MNSSPTEIPSLPRRMRQSLQYRRLVRVADITQKCVLPCSLAAYVLGFIVTSIHLGAYGVSSVDLIRSQYIATGVLFSVYVGLIVLPLWGFITTLHRARDHGFRRLIHDALEYSAVTWFVVAIAVGAARQIFGKLPPPPPDWSISYFKNAAFSSILALTSAAIVWRYFNTGDGDVAEEQNNESSAKFRIWRIWARGRPALLVLVGCFLLMFVGGLCWDLLEAAAAKSTEGGDEIAARGWSMLFIVPLLVYIAVGSLCLMAMAGFWFLDSGTMLRRTDRDPPFPPSGLALLLLGAMFAATVIPAFSLQVYPWLPSYVGGGRPAPVKVLFDEKVTARWLSSASELAILYRNSASTIMLVGRGSDVRTVELPNGDIRSIEYLRNAK